ncbi:MAG: MgtC/SapB family protein [Clostridia bacterium]|nr:MgtC/SapB family protein [Clostridia bacterium]
MARLVLACILGGIIGYERESMHRPAGFRTHILVCVGSALVMITSEFIFKRYQGLTNIDPARLGAQVISGIGFLGAGTIIREGFSVKGLTTAASLWAVSCVGIAAGIGFYEGAIAATLIIYITLIVLKRLEDNFSRTSKPKNICILSSNVPGYIGEYSAVLKKLKISVKNIEFTNIPEENSVLIKFHIIMPKGFKKELIMDELQKLNSVQRVFEE